jgi:hypothetical protein
MQDCLLGGLGHEAGVVRAKRFMFPGELQCDSVVHAQQHGGIFGGANERLRFGEGGGQAAHLPASSLKPLHDDTAMDVQQLKSQAAVDHEMDRRDGFVRMKYDVAGFAPNDFGCVRKLLNCVVAETYGARVQFE